MQGNSIMHHTGEIERKLRERLGTRSFANSDHRGFGSPFHVLVVRRNSKPGRSDLSDIHMCFLYLLAKSKGNGTESSVPFIAKLRVLRSNYERVSLENS